MSDINKMKQMLEAYRILLEKEKAMAMKDHFHTFMSQLEITDEQIVDKMEVGFTQIVKILEDDKLLLKDRLLKLVDSPFIYSILEHKNFAREREMRRLTLEISKFIEAASEGVTTNEQFLKNLLARSLREAADSIQSETLKASERPTNEAWVDALKLGLEVMATKQKI